MSSPIKSRHRSYSTIQPPAYTPPFFTPIPITETTYQRPRKYATSTSSSSSSSSRSSTVHSRHSRSAPATPPNEPNSSSIRRHATSVEFGNNLFITPAKPPLPRTFASRSSSQLALKAAPACPLVQPQVHALYRPPSYGSYFFDNDDKDDEDSLIYPTYSRGATGNPSTTTAAATTMSKTAGSLRARLFGAKEKEKGPKSISTTPGLLGAGETETEADEPPEHLPTSRIIPASGPLVPPDTLQHLLFEFSRFLSIVPAVIGLLYNVYQIFNTTEGGGPGRIDYFVSALWAILTGYQCLRLTTGLLARWRLYYPPLPTLIRLLALQAICWPMTHATLQVLEHGKRPLVCWAVIGTFTCVSRSVQIWVTSNLWWETRRSEGGPGANVGSKLNPSSGSGSGDGGEGPWGDGAANATGRKEGARDENGRRRYKYGSYKYWRRWGGGRWGGRRWDWGEVGVQCMLPAGIVYFVMAWAEVLRREMERGGGC